MLVVKNLESFYGNVQAVWGVSLEVKQGEIVSVIGTNGAGKTTIMQSIVGLVDRKGTITFEGKDISNTPPHKMVDLGIAYVPEGRMVFPEMTVKENLYIGSYNKNAKKKRQESYEYVLDMFPRLQERINNLAGNLSGGEQQMLAIGRGLMSNPKLILLDEPSLGIAPILVGEIFETIDEIKKDITVVLVEQHVEHALAICDRGYVIVQGTISISGTGEELRDNEQIKKLYLGI